MADQAKEYGESWLVSACLLGEPCRYDGRSCACAAARAFVECLQAAGGRVVPMCPEQLGGLPTPRVPSELQPDGRVLDAEGADRTDAFKRGAAEAVRIAREQGCSHALLKAKSPSCGAHFVYDGSFSGTLVAGAGVAAEALRAAGLTVIDETDLV